MKKITTLLFVSLLCLFSLAARNFNGTSDGGSSGAGAVANKGIFGSGGASSFTVAFWLWQNSWASTGEILEESSNSDGNTNAFNIVPGGIGCSGKISFGQHQGGGNYRFRFFNNPTAGVWHHFVFELDTAGTGYAAYVDGVSQSLSNCDSNSPNTTTGYTDYPLCVMSRGCSTTRFNAGKMAELAVWRNVLLSANENKALASCTPPWSIRAESLTYYAPLWGADSVFEPSYAVNSNGTNSLVLSGTTFTAGPPNCPAPGL